MLVLAAFARESDRIRLECLGRAGALVAAGHSARKHGVNLGLRCLSLPLWPVIAHKKMVMIWVRDACALLSGLRCLTFEYGGWGYVHGPPRKPAAGQTADPAALPNLSATAFGLEALRAAGRPGDDPAFGRTMHFVCNCHNFVDDSAGRDPAFDDGGGFFVLGDLPRNKAGVAGTDRRGRERFASYGSTTADGLRALLACGLPRNGACDGGLSLAHRQLLRGSTPGPLRAGPKCVADVGVLLLVLVGGARAGGRRCGRRSVGRAARRGVGAAAATGRLVGQRRRRGARGRPDRGDGAGGRGAVNLPLGAAVLKCASLGFGTYRLVYSRLTLERPGVAV